MWAVTLVLAAIVGAVFALAGWIFAVPISLLAIGAYWVARDMRRRSGAEEVSRLRDQADKAAPLDKGGIEFTDRDRETLSS